MKSGHAKRRKQRGRLALVDVITEMWSLAETKQITNQRNLSEDKPVDLAEKRLWISFCFQSYS